MSAQKLVSRRLGQWVAARAALAELEKAEHPDIVDKFGRTWRWRGGDLYEHCGMAWPESTFTSPHYTLPTDAVLDNPNYKLCSTCRGGR